MAKKTADKILAKDASESMKPRGISKGSMLNEDMSAPSNLPRNVVRTQYPSMNYPYMQRDDSLNMMDATTKSDIAEMKRYPSKRK